MKVLVRTSCLWVVVNIFYLMNPIFGQWQFMTFNLRFDNPADGFNDWNHRKNDVANLITKYNPEVIGTQEGLIHQLKDLEAQLPEFSFFGQSRDDGGEKGEFCAIFYNTKRWQLLNTETFWLSASGEVGSKGWDAALPRIVTYGVLLSKLHEDTIHVFNAHYDHMGEMARRESSILIAKLIKEKKLSQAKVILLGDFNAVSREPAIQFLKETFEYHCLDYLENNSVMGTFNGFNDQEKPNKIIDHIFTLNLEIDYSLILSERRKDGGFISDHFPVLITTVSN